MFRSAKRRFILLGIASLLIHAALLWLPAIRLPRAEVPIPLLSAKLVPLPKVAAQPKGAPRHRREPTPQPPPAAAARPDMAAIALNPAALPQSAVAAASSVAPAQMPPPQSAVAAASAEAASAVAPTVDYAQTAVDPPELPKHAQLRFDVMVGNYRIYAGEIRHELEISDGRYTLHAEVETTHFARLIKRYENIQDSRGTVTREHGLRADKFTEAKTDEQGTQRSEAVFDWSAHEIRFVSGAKASLPDGAGDILSFLYQLSQLPYNKGTIPLAICNGRKLDFYTLGTRDDEVIDSPMGKLSVLHLTKIRKPGDEGMEVWLAREYRLLPVKVRYLNRDGSLAAEVLIREIRASDQ